MKISLFKHNIGLIFDIVFAYFAMCFSYTVFLLVLKLFLESSHGFHAHLPFLRHPEGDIFLDHNIYFHEYPLESITFYRGLDSNPRKFTVVPVV